MPTATMTRGAAPAAASLPFDLGSLHQLFTGIEVPDPITFICGEEWLDRGNIYPRQATLIKVIFLREDLFTDYDYDVVEEWEEQYRISNGTEGLAPGVIFKMRMLRARGHHWFREVLLVMGRRAGKGHVTALCMLYVLWCYMAKGNPQKYYGVDKSKKFVCLVFAGKRDQAKATVFGDLQGIITDAPCFQPYINDNHTEKVSIYAPGDFVRIRKQRERGIKVDRDQATFVIQPRESTVMAGRGPTSFQQCYDEMAHVVASGANRSASEVYDAAKPSLDQFGKDAFIMEPSSPWQMNGQFYGNWQHANEKDEDGDFAYPDMLSIQLASWDIYLDWERTNPAYVPETLALLPEGFLGDLGEYEPGSENYRPLPQFQVLHGAIQVYDDQMKREERANPDTFKVERRSKWAASLEAYLNENKVNQIFEPWLDRPERYGPPVLHRQVRGIMTHTYKGHADPSKVNDKFGVALAHVEYDDEGRPHCVFDLLHHFDPADYPDNIIDYESVDEWIWENVLKPFMPGEFTFDQYNSTSSIQRLAKRVRAERLAKRTEVFEKTTTAKMDWDRWETFKASTNMNLVHCFSIDQDEHAERASLELRFLESPKPGRVDHPSSGPVQSKDIADCYDSRMEVLTERGWMLFKDVPKGIKVATRSPEGRLEYQEPTDYIARHHKGLMYEYDSHRLNFSVTPRHRMLVVDPSGRQRFVHAEDLTSQRYFIPKTAVLSERPSGVITFDHEDLTAAQVRVVGRGGNRKGAGWSEEQDQYLTEHYASASMVDLCSVLGKTRSAIYKRANNLNLKRGQIGDRIGDRPVPLPETKIEDFAAFLGIWLAEGRKMRDKAGYEVKITQTKPDAIEWIDQMFARLPWPVSRSVQANGETVWVVKSHGLREYLRACQGEAHELLIPDEVFATWSQVEMERLLEGLLVGDGCWSEQQGRHVGYYSTSKRLIDDVQRLVLHLGLTSGSAKIVQRTSQYRANHDLWYVGVNTSQRATLETAKMKVVEHDDMVYCLSVPNTTLLVRRSGVPMWSGNCMAECVDVLIGEQVNNFLQNELSSLRPATGLQGGMDPFPETRMGGMGDFETEQRLSAMSGVGRARGRAEHTPSRQPARRAGRRGGRS